MQDRLAHPTIQRERAVLEAEHVKAQAAWEATEPGTPEYERTGKILDGIEAQLDWLDLAATDPAAHGYPYGEG